jgi:hypothetical protein
MLMRTTHLLPLTTLLFPCRETSKSDVYCVCLVLPFLWGPEVLAGIVKQGTFGKSGDILLVPTSKKAILGLGVRFKV